MLMRVLVARSLLIGFGGVLLAGCAGAPVGMPGAPAYRLVEVVGTGDSTLSAEKAAINAAIGEASGQLILGEQRVEEDRLVRDRVDSYSAGYIRDHEVLETWRGADGRYRARVRARVASSSIHHRAQPVSTGGGRLPGRQVATEIRTQFEQRESGDRMLAVVLDGYPEQAYTVTLGSIRSAFDSRRNPSVAVRYSVRFSPLYLNALAEVAGVIAADAKSCNGLQWLFTGGTNDARQSGGRSFSLLRLGQDVCSENSDLLIHSYRPGNVLTSTAGMFFADDGPCSLINARFDRPLFLRADFYDEADRQVSSACRELGRSAFQLGGGLARQRIGERRDQSREGWGPPRPELSALASIDGEWNMAVSPGGNGVLASVVRVSVRAVSGC